MGIRLGVGLGLGEWAKPSPKPTTGNHGRWVGVSTIHNITVKRKCSAKVAPKSEAPRCWDRLGPVYVVRSGKSRKRKLGKLPATRSGVRFSGPGKLRRTTRTHQRLIYFSCECVCERAAIVVPSKPNRTESVPVSESETHPEASLSLAHPQTDK